MKKFITLLFAAALSFSANAQTVGPQIFCNQVFPTGTLSAGTTLLAAGQAGRIISVCGWNIEGLGNGTLQLVFGTGPTCTSPTALTPVVTTSNSSNIVDHTATAFASSLAGQSACMVATGTSIATATIYYYVQP